MKNPDGWIKMCLGKKPMPERYAEAVVKRAKKQGNYLRPYLCPSCCQWHVTSQKPEVKK